MKSALGKAATPGGLPSSARSPQELVAQLNRLVSDEFAKLKIPEALRSTYQAAADHTGKLRKQCSVQPA
jgi:hypothetical protein